jgi:5-methylcytosine-specific restriction endonuclease McrA
MVIDCDAPVFSIGYCGAHYHRLRRHGRLELVERPLLTPEVLATLKKDVRESKVRRQRARVNGKTRYRKRDIFERDNWTCHLCGDGIDSTLKYPHRMSASIDHVIPIAYFGPDEPENLAASHLICNLRKGHRVA